MNNNYLEHHGILGQKWGVRRFQNEDGSYTSLGKRRYDENKQNSEEKLSRKINRNIDKVGDTYNNNKKSINKGLAIGAATLATLSVIQTANNLSFANWVLEDYGKVAIKDVVKLGSLAAGKAAVKGALIGGTASVIKSKVSNNNSK